MTLFISYLIKTLCGFSTLHNASCNVQFSQSYLLNSTCICLLKDLVFREGPLSEALTKRKRIHYTVPFMI